MRTSQNRRLRLGLLITVLSVAMLSGGCPTAPSNANSLTVGIEVIASGLVSPVALTPSPDHTGRLFVAEQTGQIRVLGVDGTLQESAFLDISDKLVQLSGSYDERGLLGLAFHPAYAANRRFYVYYSAPLSIEAPAGFDSQLVLSEFRAAGSDPTVADAASERVLLRIPHPQANHNGGQLAFGPDGFLYIGTGDGGASGDNGNGHNASIGNAQDRNSLLGKILRIDVDTGNPYGIPTDNPFVGVENARGEVFASGFRNPWRFSFAADGRLFVGDVGQNRLEEVDIVTRGGNYGWRIREGDTCYDKDNPANEGFACAAVDADGSPLIDPILIYPHNGGTIAGSAIAGGYLYRGSAVPTLKDRYVFGDYSAGFLQGDGALFAGQEAGDGSWSAAPISIKGRTNGRIGEYLKAIGEGADGELYLLTSERAGPTGTTGRVSRIVRAD